MELEQLQLFLWRDHILPQIKKRYYICPDNTYTPPPPPPPPPPPLRPAPAQFYVDSLPVIIRCKWLIVTQIQHTIMFQFLLDQACFNHLNELPPNICSYNDTDNGHIIV